MPQLAPHTGDTVQPELAVSHISGADNRAKKWSRMRQIKHCFNFAGAALLVACATPTPTPAPGQTLTQTSAAVAEPTSNDKFQVPIGYQKIMVNGEAHYCRNDVDTGSHISRSRVCYTLAQLKLQDEENQRSISSSIQNSNALGTAVGAGAPSNGR
jgi:hypothetical protein